MITSTAPGAVDVVPARSARPIADSASDTRFDTVPDRDLYRHELLDLAASIAAQPHLWRDRVEFDDHDRHYVSLHRDEHVDVWLLCWTPRNDTGWHDHDISSGAVAVAEGRIVEQNLALGTPSVTTEIEAGKVYDFGPDHIHRMTGQAPQSVSIHAYSPPLLRMGQYVVSATGVLRRTSVSYADELRAFDDVPGPAA